MNTDQEIENATYLDCPIAGCQIKRVKTHLLCTRHWGMLPLITRQNIFNAFQERHRSPEHEARHAALCQEALQRVEAYLRSEGEI